MKIVFTAMSKHLYYFRDHISKFVLEQGNFPINPFKTFDYFMIDSIDREIIRNANNFGVERADELWVFGPISNGVLAEIKLAKKKKKPIRYFDIINSKKIIEISEKDSKIEKGLVVRNICPKNLR